jgi:predicted transcriptional regulator
MKKSSLNAITKAQEEILRVVWEIGDGAITDVLEKLPDPKPAYNTVATVIKVLEKKGYLGHRTYGKTNVYHALVSRDEYGADLLKDAFIGLFNRSLNNMVSPLIQNNDFSLAELEELKQIVESEIKKQQK